MWQRYPHNPSAYDDDFEDQPKQGPFYKWVLGVIVPLSILYYAVHAIITQHALYGSSQEQLLLNGTNAIAFGVAAISLALFMHCHYFWGNVYEQVWFAVLGKIISACGFIGSLGILLVRVGVLGLNR